MTDNLKPCPFCNEPMSEDNFYSCDGYPKACGCWEHTKTADDAEKVWNTRPIEDALRAQLAEAQAEVDRLTVQLEEAGKALSGLGYTPSADDSGSYDSLIPDKYL